MLFIQITSEKLSVILNLFSKKLDNEGFICEEKSGNLLKCPYTTKKIHSNNFSILPGSAIFVNNSPFVFAEHIATQMQKGLY